MKSNFIITTDEETAKKLSKQGFQMIEQNNNIWKFLNCSNLLFDGDNHKILYTNMLNI